jgi:hypothetical protein
VEIASEENHSPFDNLIASYLSANDLGLEMSSRDQADVVLCLVFEENFEALKRVFLHNPKTPIVICLKENKMDLHKKIDGWIYGCKLPSKIPTPLIIDSDKWSDILKITRNFARR